MHLLVIGGSGQSGRLVIDEAIQRGHTITALLRDPNAVPARNGLEVVQGTPLEISDVEKAFAAHEGQSIDAVIVTLASPKVEGTRVMVDAHSNLLSVMEKHKVPKIVTLSSFGTGSSYSNVSILLRGAISYTKLGYSYADHNLVDDEVKKSGLNFVLLRPSRLTMAEKAPVKFFGDDGRGTGVLAGMGGISRKSVAGLLLDAVEMDTWDRTTPVVSN